MDDDRTLSQRRTNQGVGHDNHLPPGTWFDDLEILETVAAGGFGIVYRTRDHSLDRIVALKEYMPTSLAARDAGTQNVRVRSPNGLESFDIGLKSFVKEAKFLAQFDHPAVVKVHRFFRANGTAYMVMTFYEGVTLKDKLASMQAPPDEAWLVGFLAPLMDALTMMHSENCFHRDIAPDNILLLKGSDKPVLLDFGATRHVIKDAPQALTVILKPSYAPIEQYDDLPGMTQGAWTDVYALAATLYAAITGRPPPTAQMRLHRDACIPAVTAGAGKYSESFLRALDHALVVLPDQRTGSIKEMRQEMGLAAPTVKPAPPTRPDLLAVAGTEPRRRRWPAIAIGCTVAVVSAVGVMVRLSSSNTVSSGTSATVVEPAFVSGSRPVRQDSNTAERSSVTRQETPPVGGPSGVASSAPVPAVAQGPSLPEVSSTPARVTPEAVTPQAPPADPSPSHPDRAPRPPESTKKKTPIPAVATTRPEHPPAAKTHDSNSASEHCADLSNRVQNGSITYSAYAKDCLK